MGEGSKHDSVDPSVFFFAFCGYEKAKYGSTRAELHLQKYGITLTELHLQNTKGEIRNYT